MKPWQALLASICGGVAVLAIQAALSTPSVDAAPQVVHVPVTKIVHLPGAAAPAPPTPAAQPAVEDAPPAKPVEPFLNPFTGEMVDNPTPPRPAADSLDVYDVRRTHTEAAAAKYDLTDVQVDRALDLAARSRDQRLEVQLAIARGEVAQHEAAEQMDQMRRQAQAELDDIVGPDAAAELASVFGLRGSALLMGSTQE